jgi:Domain of unknown function (DUF4432)
MFSTVTDGRAHGCRALDVRVAEGIDLRILLDRGFDIAAAWFRGVQLAWISAVGEVGPLASLSGEEWLEAFGGGLVTTCGLRNVGASSEGYGLHGRYSHERACDVRVDRRVEGDEVVVTAAATVDEVEALGPHLRVERTLRTRTGQGLVELTDVTTNLGREPEPAPVLYHVNLGYPLLDDAATLATDASRTIPRDNDAERGLGHWTRPGAAPQRFAPMVFEHEVAGDAAGWAEATLANERLGLAFTVRWHTAALPRFHQWTYTAPGVYVLGLEPANCSVLGRAADRAAGRLPVLAPGEQRRTELQLTAARL